MRELLRLLLCALCVTAIVSEDLLTKEIPKERKEFLRRFLEAGAKARGNGPVAEDRFQEIDAAAVLERQGGVSDDWAKCPAGLAGQDCKNPRCDKRSKLHSHDGTLGHGETLELAYSNECSDNFTFPVDSYVNDIAIYVLSLGQSPPYATLRDPAGKLIDPTKSITEDSNGFRAVYANLAATHGPGSFNVKVSSLSIKSCVIQVWAPSTVVIDGGFVTDKTSDDVQRVMPLPYYAIERNPVDGVPSYLAFKVSAISYPAQPIAVKYFLDTVFEMEHDVITRYNCWASHIVSDPLTCDNAGTYNFKVSGIDSNGYTFQRVYDFECDAEVPTGPTTSPAPTTPPKPATQCFNGGSLINQGQPNATCYCNPLFAGRECEKKLCFNDGIDIDGVCVCADGFSGNHCEDVVCTTLSDGAFDLNQRALVFIVRGGSSMANLIGSVKDAANNIVNLMKGNYFETYILVAFNNHNIEKMISTRDPEEFVNQIGSISTTKDNGCSDGVLGAVSSALSMKDLMKYPHSPVFVFTDGLPDDPRSVQANLLNQLSFFRGELNFIITKDPNQGCAIDTSSDQYLMLRELAQFSQGLVMNGIPLNEIDLVPFNIVYTIQTLNYIHSNDFMDSCNDAPLFQSVFISEGMEGFAFLATGDNLTVTVINPQRKVIKSDNPNTSGDLTLNTYSTDGISGNYLVSVKSATGSPCQYRIGEQANNDLFFSTSKGIHDDSYSMEPLYDASSHVVARINNMPYTEYRDVKAEVLIWTNEPQSDKRKVLFAGSGTYRDSCDYSLYFGSWICETRDMFFYVTVFVNDNQGFTVQRTTTGICSYAIPPSVPPSGCLNGGVADDVTNGTCLCPPTTKATGAKPSSARTTDARKLLDTVAARLRLVDSSVNFRLVPRITIARISKIMDDRSPSLCTTRTVLWI
ncbi:hypothetical protein L596_029705 [Steinernema carpocapsae]|uniref:EGF-like domain-containing protein n=1 Tax=Steinernema carpocapsae TaxID=34508 RepID=A0A4U5LQI2_STECR|nr:hypothetical protein L596_029705 [Steinernema carpocapsae]